MRISANRRISDVEGDDAFSVVGVNDGGSGDRTTLQNPSGSTLVDSEDVPTTTNISALGVPQPQTGMGAECCSVICCPNVFEMVKLPDTTKARQGSKTPANTGKILEFSIFTTEKATDELNTVVRGLRPIH